MKIHSTIFFLVGSLLLAGCEPGLENYDPNTPPESEVQARRYNEVQLAKDGVTVGRLPDGREVKIWDLRDPDNHYYHNYVYVVESAKSIVTENREERHGKIMIHRVDVTANDSP
jgi:hypothetical protein